MTLRYRDATALRRAIDARLKQEAADTGSDLARRRRLVVFDRVAVRLSADRTVSWILKGGAVLEFRMRGKARATRDMDFAARSTDGERLDGPTVRDMLIEALAVDQDGNGFAFRVSTATPISADAAGRGGWRFSVESRLAGTTFATIRVDIVDRGEEIAATEQLPLPSPLAFAGTPPRTIEVMIDASMSRRRCTPTRAPMAIGRTRG